MQRRVERFSIKELNFITLSDFPRRQKVGHIAKACTKSFKLEQFVYLCGTSQNVAATTSFE